MKIIKVNEKLDNVTITDNTVVIPQPMGAAVEESENMWERFEEATKEPEDAPLFGAKEQPVPEEPVEAKITLDESLFNESWTDVYSQFVDIVDKYFPDEEQIEVAVKDLYDSHKGEPAWDEAWRRWNDTDDDDLEESLEEGLSDVKALFNGFIDAKDIDELFAKADVDMDENLQRTTQNENKFLKYDVDKGVTIDNPNNIESVDDLNTLSKEIDNYMGQARTIDSAQDDLDVARGKENVDDSTIVDMANDIQKLKESETDIWSQVYSKLEESKYTVIPVNEFDLQVSGDTKKAKSIAESFNLKYKLKDNADKTSTITIQIPEELVG